jgi:hypothetical protein
MATRHLVTTVFGAVTASLEVESLYENGVKEQATIDKKSISAVIQKSGLLRKPSICSAKTA